jgi:hypothetical protein
LPQKEQEKMKREKLPGNKTVSYDNTTLMDTELMNAHGTLSKNNLLLLSLSN